MNQPNAVDVFLALVAIAAMGYIALRLRRRRRELALGETGVDFRPKIGFTRLDGWSSLALLLENKSDTKVWAEEVEIALTELVANDQTAPATCHEIQKIRQAAPPEDMLPVSLVETIYKAAGNPQRKYSCVLSSVVRYRIGEEWFEKPLRPYRLKMAGLTVRGNSRESWDKSEFKPHKSSNPQVVATRPH